jgi:hypothetical protein
MFTTCTFNDCANARFTGFLRKYGMMMRQISDKTAGDVKNG